MKNKIKLKYIVGGCLGIILVVMLMYFASNYNRFKIYTFNGSNERVSVDGNAMFSSRINVLNITGVRYYDQDVKIKSIDVGVFAKTGEKERLIFAKGGEFEPTGSLIDYLDKFSFSVFEQNGYNELFTPEIIKNFQDSVYFRINYVDEDGKAHEEVIKLESKLYSNNGFFYKKASSI